MYSTVMSIGTQKQFAELICAVAKLNIYAMQSSNSNDKNISIIFIKVRRWILGHI